MSLGDFLGQELMSGVARLDGSMFFGAWAGGNPIEVRRRARFNPVLYREDHVHQHPEFCHLLSGKCRFSFEHRTSELEPGDVVVCSGGVPHAETFCNKRSAYRLAWWILLEKDPMLHVRRYRAQGGYDVEHVIRLTTLSTYGEERLQILREIAGRASRQRPGLEIFREAMLSVILELYRQVLKGGNAI